MSLIEGWLVKRLCGMAALHAEWIKWVYCRRGLSSYRSSLPLCKGRKARAGVECTEPDSHLVTDMLSLGQFIGTNIHLHNGRPIFLDRSRRQRRLDAGT